MRSDQQRSAPRHPRSFHLYLSQTPPPCSACRGKAIAGSSVSRLNFPFLRGFHLLSKSANFVWAVSSQLRTLQQSRPLNNTIKDFCSQKNILRQKICRMLNISTVNFKVEHGTRRDEKPRYKIFSQMSVRAVSLFAYSEPVNFCLWTLQSWSMGPFINRY